MHHAGDIAELKLGKHSVEYLEGFMDLLRVVRGRREALHGKIHTYIYMYTRMKSEKKLYIKISGTTGISSRFSYFLIVIFEYECLKVFPQKPKILRNVFLSTYCPLTR